MLRDCGHKVYERNDWDEGNEKSRYLCMMEKLSVA